MTISSKSHKNRSSFFKNQWLNIRPNLEFRVIDVGRILLIETLTQILTKRKLDLISVILSTNIRYPKASTKVLNTSVFQYSRDTPNNLTHIDVEAPKSTNGFNFGFHLQNIKDIPHIRPSKLGTISEHQNKLLIECKRNDKQIIQDSININISCRDDVILTNFRSRSMVGLRIKK